MMRLNAYKGVKPPLEMDSDSLKTMLYSMNIKMIKESLSCLILECT